MAEFEKMETYPLLDGLVQKAKTVTEKYTVGGKFSYDAALAQYGSILHCLCLTNIV